MKNWMVIMLAAAMVIAGAFLPELLLKSNSQPELDMTYQQVTITSQSSSDYTWRMERMAEHYFGEGEQLLSTYISEETSGEGESGEQFLTELDKLTQLGVIPEAVLEQVADGDVILLHDLYDGSVDAALAIVDKLRAQGFRFVTASQLAREKGVALQPGKVYRKF